MITTTRQPPPGARPVDDVFGVRPGMGWDEATRHVMCSHALMVVSADQANRFQLPTFGQPLRQGFYGRIAQPRVVKSSRDYLKEMQDGAIARGSNRAVHDVKPGESKWYLGTLGLQGQERVTHVTREEWFPEAELPPLDLVEQALVKKYGTPTQRSTAGGYLALAWAHDPDGRRPASNHHGCGLHPSPEAGVNLSTGCELAVRSLPRSKGRLRPPFSLGAASTP